jgi:hypothetical protein
MKGRGSLPALGTSGQVTRKMMMISQIGTPSSQRARPLNMIFLLSLD